MRTRRAIFSRFSVSLSALPEWIDTVTWSPRNSRHTVNFTDRYCNLCDVETAEISTQLRSKRVGAVGGLERGPIRKREIFLSLTKSESPKLASARRRYAGTYIRQVGGCCELVVET